MKKRASVAALAPRLSAKSSLSSSRRLKFGEERAAHFLSLWAAFFIMYMTRELVNRAKHFKLSILYRFDKKQKINTIHNGSPLSKMGSPTTLASFMYFTCDTDNLFVYYHIFDLLLLSAACLTSF